MFDAIGPVAPAMSLVRNRTFENLLANLVADELVVVYPEAQDSMVCFAAERFFLRCTQRNEILLEMEAELETVVWTIHCLFRLWSETSNELQNLIEKCEEQQLTKDDITLFRSLGNKTSLENEFKLYFNIDQSIITQIVNQIF